MKGVPSPGADISLGFGEKAATEVVVVGAGVGGLATAARLAKAGCLCVEIVVIALGLLCSVLLVMAVLVLVLVFDVGSYCSRYCCSWSWCCWCGFRCNGVPYVRTPLL